MPSSSASAIPEYAEAAALRHESDRAFFKIRILEADAEATVHAVDEVHRADAVGTDHAHAALGDGGLRLGFERYAFRPDFAKTGAEYGRERDARFAALADHLGYEAAGDRDEREIAGLGHVGHARVARESPIFGYLGLTG